MIKNKIIQSSLAFLMLSSASYAKDIIIELPKVPEVPKVITIQNTQKVSSTNNDDVLQDKKVKFSNHVAPVIQKSTATDSKSTKIGDIKNGRVSANLNIPYQNVDNLSKRLNNAGFNIISSYTFCKDGRITSLVITNPELIKNASKTDRGFGATLRITVDNQAKTVTINNPLYALKTTMQTQYDKDLALSVLDTLRKEFSKLSETQEVLKFSALDNFQFMPGMPKYQNMQVIAKKSNNELLNSARKSKRVVFEQKLENGAILVGVKLSDATTKFIKNTGFKNAALLPYPVLIQNNEAKILDPKYYIAVMYPKLKMSQFMSIAAVPDAITKDIDKVFR